MINKEIILGDGTIVKDFQDRNIPQYQNNQVSVNALIPSQLFNGLQNYAVLLALSRSLDNGNTWTTLNTIIMTASKSITLGGVLYVKYSAILSYSYTDKIGTLKISPYIQTTATTTVDNESVEVISIQKSFTNSNLNVIKSVLPQYDASMEEATTATTLASQIASKKIYTFVDTDSASLGQHYYELATGYDPNADQFKGCLVISVYDGETRQYMPYLNDGVELLEITKDGKFYRISGVDYSNSTYTYTRLQLSYSKGEIDTNFYKKTETYNKAETDTLLNAKVDKTQKINGHALSGDIKILKSDVGIDLGNVANYGVESTPTASGSNLYITSKGVYDALQLIYGILATMPTEQEFNAVKGRISDIETLIGDSDGDDDNVINTLKEVIATLSGLGEDANILSMINAKANQSDFNTLNNQINGTGGIKDKVDILTSQDNAYMEIKNSLGTIDILTSDWVVNTGDTEYPYKWELTNGYLEGAVNCIVVYSKDSDTSMLSATAGIDEENGKLVIYASELPTETISIEKIAVFNDINAYITYSNEIVQQVLQNTSAISDINNTKLPQYVKKEVEKGSYTYGIAFDDISNKVDFYLRKKEGGQVVGAELITIEDEKITLGIFANNIIHELTFDDNGDLKIDGNAVGGGVLTYATNTAPIDNSTYYTLDSQYASSNIKVGDYLLYVDSGTIKQLFSVVSISNNTLELALMGQYGGGKQLYQHNITCSTNGGSRLCFKIINDSDISFNTLWTSETDIRNWLNQKGFNSNAKMYECSGSAGVNNGSYNFSGIFYYVDTLNNKYLKAFVTLPNGTYTDFTISFINQITDTIILL